MALWAANLALAAKARALARRRGLQLQTGAAVAALAGDYAALGLAQHRTWERVGGVPLVRRANDRLAAPVRPPAPGLGSTQRTPESVPPTRLGPNMPDLSYLLIFIFSGRSSPHRDRLWGLAVSCQPVPFH
jgi:hypothetical protein